jgi:hypothetical protein
MVRRNSLKKYAGGGGKMKRQRWIEEDVSKIFIIPEIKEMLQLQQYVQKHYSDPHIMQQIPDGFVRCGLFVPIAFPDDVSVSYIVKGPNGTDVESWPKEQVREYFEEHIYLRLKDFKREVLQKKFHKQLHDTYGYTVEEYYELPPEEKVTITCEVLIEITLVGGIPEFL